MGPWGLFAVSVVAYSVLPLAFGLARSPSRYLLTYAYVATILTIGGLIGGVHVIPLADGLTLNPGSIAYAALVASTLIATISANDIRVVRDVIRIVVVVDIIKVAVFWVTRRALVEGLPNPSGVPVELFEVSLRVVVFGGVLIVGELFVLMVLLERAKRLGPERLLPVACVVGFVAVLCLDGVLFPLAIIPTSPELGSVIAGGVAAKLLLALAFAVPLTLFLLLARDRVRVYGRTRLPLGQFLFAPRAELEAAFDEQARVLIETTEREARHAVASQVLADVPSGTQPEDLLERVLVAVGPVPGVRGEVGLRVIDGAVTIGAWGLSDRIEDGAVTATYARRAQGQAVWIDELHEVGAIACVPVGEGPAYAVVELLVDRAAGDATVAELQTMRNELRVTIRPTVAELRRRWDERASMASVLESASLSVVFQPIVRLDDRSVVSWEGLSRFEPGVSVEGRFREAARLGVAVELDLLAARSILEAATDLPEAAPVAINLSPRTLGSPGLRDLLESAGRLVEVEITEHDPVRDYTTLLEQLAALDGFARLVVDDAGSGYASMQHILRLRPHAVKIDRALVSGIDGDRPRQVLVSGLLSLAEEIGATVIAEGVEREEEATVLRELGVPLAQGYLFGRPAPMASWLRPQAVDQPIT